MTPGFGDKSGKMADGAGAETGGPTWSASICKTCATYSQEKQQNQFLSGDASLIVRMLILEWDFRINRTYTNPAPVQCTHLALALDRGSLPLPPPR